MSLKEVVVVGRPGSGKDYAAGLIDDMSYFYHFENAVVVDTLGELYKYDMQESTIILIDTAWLICLERMDSAKYIDERSETIKLLLYVRELPQTIVISNNDTKADLKVKLNKLGE